MLDLLDHLLKSGRGRIIGTRTDLFGKGLNFSLESFHLDGLAVMIESLVSGDRGQVQRLAQLVEQLAVGFQPVEGVPQGAILDQVVQVQTQVVERQVAPPLFAGAQSEEGLELGVDLLRPAGQRQERAIKGKP